MQTNTKDNKTDDLQKQIMTATMRKNMNIAFFNANNNACDMVTKLYKSGDDEMTRCQIIDWRDWFLNQYKEYYITTIEPINDTTMTVAKAIATICIINDITALSAYYGNLPDDIRNNADVLDVAKRHTESLQNFTDMAIVPDVQIDADDDVYIELPVDNSVDIVDKKPAKGKKK